MLQEKTIMINGIEYKLKRSWKSLILFEELANKTVDKMNSNVTDFIKLFYCILKANNKHFEKTYDEFLDFIEENEDAVEQFTNYIHSIANPDETEEDKKKV